jgi:hypothetical protein
MRYKTIKVFVYFMLSFSLSGCDPDLGYGNRNVEGYKPVYASATDKIIEFEMPQDIHVPGKIYSYGKYLLINEFKKGIHFFDNSDPSSPKPLGFLKVAGNVDMAVRNNVLYVDHISSLVALNITDLADIKELSRIRQWSSSLPPSDTHYYFECVDPQKGEVIGWELVTLKNPKCSR